MKTTAAQAQQAGVQARSAAAAYQDAYLMTVPPAAVAANRALHAALVATNILGQNTSAIAATEALYSEMWAQDATAMYSYAARSAQAIAVPTFAPAPQVTNPAAPATQASAATTSSTTGAGSSLTQLASALAGVTGPGSSGGGFPILDTIGDIAGDLSGIGFLGEAGLWIGAAPPFMAEAAVWIIAGGLFMVETFASGGFTGAGGLASALTPSTLMPSTLASASLVDSGLGVHGAQLSAASAVSAEMGQAPGIRGLSVPQTWATAAPEAHLARTAALTSGAAAPTMANTPVLGAVPLAGTAGSPLSAGSAGGGLRGTGEARTADADAAYSSRHGYPGADPRTAKELREVDELREQNARLKRLLADAELEKDALRKAARGKFSPP